MWKIAFKEFKVIWSVLFYFFTSWKPLLKTFSRGTEREQNRPYHFNFFKGCLSQILLAPFLNIFSQLWLLNVLNNFRGCSFLKKSLSLGYRRVLTRVGHIWNILAFSGSRSSNSFLHCCFWSWRMKSEAYSELSQTFKTELFAKMVNGLQLLTILLKSSILDVWLDFEYASKSRDVVHI